MRHNDPQTIQTGPKTNQTRSENHPKMLRAFEKEHLLSENDPKMLGASKNNFFGVGE